MASIKAIAAIALTLIVAVPILMGYGMASTEATTTSWETESTTNVTELLYNSSENYYATYVGTTNNSELTSGLTPNYVSVTENVTSYPTMTTETVSITFTAGTKYSMAAYESWSFVAPANGYKSWYIYGDDYDHETNTGTVTMNALPFRSGDTVTGRGTTIYGGPTYVTFPNADQTVDVTVYTNEGMYADVTAGWKLPEDTDYWENNQTNSEVVFALYLPSGSEVKFNNFRLTNTSGTVTMTYSPQGVTYSYTLGNYSYLWVVLDLEGISVSGLSEWPEYGITPTTYNTVEHTYSTAAGDFTSVYLQNDDQNAIFRVDSAQIVAGTYPITENYWLYLRNLYPEQNVALTFKSVAAYGNWLTFGQSGQDFGPTDGKITITDLDDSKSYTIPIRGMTVKMIYDSDTATYTTYVNNHKINTAGDGAVYFGGEWSLTASASLLTETTSTRQTWAPGEFAFDKEDFAACGLLVAGACLIGLGMTGSRSGAKMGVLLMICGGAGLIYLTIL